jgi:hypothetical protein
MCKIAITLADRWRKIYDKEDTGEGMSVSKLVGKTPVDILVQP